MVDFARLKSRAKEKGRTYKYLCDQLGREKNYLSNCAGGADRLSPENLAIVADLLDTTPALWPVGWIKRMRKSWILFIISRRRNILRRLRCFEVLQILEVFCFIW